MPSRYYQRNFSPGNFYHIYNRGANKSKIFLDDSDYKTFIDILSYYLLNPIGNPLSVIDRLKSNKTKSENEILLNKVPNLVETPVTLVTFVIMPNHFHFLLRYNSHLQNAVNSKENLAIANLMRRITITYAMYFQRKYDHSGALMQGKYKNILVESDKQLLTLTKYIHLNPIEFTPVKSLEKYKFSSYPSYINKSNTPPWLDPSTVLKFFSKENPGLSYKKFIEETPLDEKSIKKFIIE